MPKRSRTPRTKASRHSKSSTSSARSARLGATAGSRAKRRQTGRRPAPSPASARSGKTIRYAVIGLGHIAQVAVLPAFAHAKRNSVLTALVSDDAQKLKKLGRRHRVEHLCGYEEADALFASGTIDAVYIALPNSMHADYAIRAARAGIHVLCEKPMAVTSEECERMIEAARENDVKLMIAYRLHFERANLEVAKLARSGKLGKLRFFTSQFSMQVADENIRVKRDKGGGPSYDIGIYCINAARYVFAAEPTEVFAAEMTDRSDERFEEVPETVTAVLKFPENRIASFTCSFGASDRAVYEVVGSKGSVTVDPAYEYAEGLAYEARIAGRTRYRQFSKSDQFAPELMHFSQCILNDREPEPSGKEGLIDVRIIEALHESLDSGRWVRLEVEERERRPTLRQEMRSRPVQLEPETVNAPSPHP